MKTIFSFLLILISAAYFSQTHRFVYEYQRKSDSTSSKIEKVNMALDSNPDEIKFYNYEYIIMDSLNKVRGSQAMIWDDQTPVIIRKKNSDKNLSYIFWNNLFTMESVDKMDWKLYNETKITGNYTLQKATVAFGGRNWTAWFNKDIELNEGPYKFRGLPGLIFEIYDSKDQHHFTLVKSYKLDKTFDTSDLLENFIGQKPVNISYNTYKKMMLENYNDPLHDFRETFSKNDNPENKFYFNSIEVKSINQFKELSEMKQKMMRQENNPIEIDKAIQYPQK